LSQKENLDLTIPKERVVVRKENLDLTIPKERVVVRKENPKMILMCWQTSRECLTLVTVV